MRHPTVIHLLTRACPSRATLFQASARVYIPLDSILPTMVADAPIAPRKRTTHSPAQSPLHRSIDQSHSPLPRSPRFHAPGILRLNSLSCYVLRQAPEAILRKCRDAVSVIFNNETEKKTNHVRLNRVRRLPRVQCCTVLLARLGRADLHRLCYLETSSLSVGFLLAAFCSSLHQIILPYTILLYYDMVSSTSFQP